MSRLTDEDSFTWDWVHVVEVIDPDGAPQLRIEHSDDIAPWKLLGMLQAAADWHRTMTTNVMFGGGEWAWMDIPDDEEDE